MTTRSKFLNNVKDKFRLILLTCFILPISGYTQNIENHDVHNSKIQHHRISFSINYAFLPQGNVSLEKTTNLVVPAIGLKYDYFINKKWAIGVHSDVEIINLLIKTDNQSDLKVIKPVILSLVGTYKPSPSIDLLAGFGKEIVKDFNIWIFRLGFEYDIHLPNSWSLSPSLIMDMKEQGFTAWTLGLVIGKKF